VDGKKTGQKIMGVLHHNNIPVSGQMVTFPEDHHAGGLYIEDQIVAGESIPFWQIVFGKGE